MTTPVLDPKFKPAVIELRKFFEDVKKYDSKQHLIIAVERDNGYVVRKEFDILPDGVDDERNSFIVERMIKCILWTAGGYKIYIHGSKKVYDDIKSYYSIGGLREFDFNFMSTCYEKTVEVIYCETQNDVPQEKKNVVKAGGHLKGRRIGFDAGGSDIKVSAIVDGEVIDSQEIVWLPKLNSDINYHYEYIMKAFHVAVDKLGGDVDGIGISTAGVIIDNRPMVSSIFIKIPKGDFEKQKSAYIDCVHKLEDELGHKIPFVVANDGDVSALAGAIDLNSNRVMGLAFGTSEAAGYVDKNGNLEGWLNELAFMPVDFNKDAMVDEWSGDFGVGCKYLSQDAVIKLADYAHLNIDKNLTLAEQLKAVQELCENGDKTAEQIFKDIGVYLAYVLAFYQVFYDIKHVLILGRVVSGKGGDIILEVARETLYKEFPEYKDVVIGMPSEKMRRVGQSIAAGSLPE